jgi:zinc transport system ATP-binding protein
MTDPILQVERLDFAYADRLVLKHIDLVMARGSTLGLIGPNGGGKTTLLRLMINQLQPTRGAIRVAGQSPCNAIHAGDVIGYVPQRTEVNTAIPLSAEQFLTLFSTTGRGDRIAYLLSAIGLGDLARQPIGLLSGGQLQRLMIARALVNSPQLLVLDEPTTGIDVASRNAFIALMENLRQEMKLSIMISSHDLHTLRVLCDDVACLNLTLHLHHRSPGDEIPLDETTCSFRPGPHAA